MSTASIIVAIISLLGVLVSYAFVQQTIARKREQKLRLIAALRARARSFKYMLNGFPAGFLSKDLTSLVQKSLAEVCEQLAKLEPNEPQHLQDLQLVTAQMTETQRSTAPERGLSLENPHQIKEVRACLEELHRFVFRLEEKQSIARTQAQVYRAQIKMMVLQLSVDSYWLHGNQARQAGKYKLAIHYYELALNLIVRESKTEEFRNRVAQLKEVVANLKEAVSQEDLSRPKSRSEQAEQEEVSSAWDKFSEDDTGWKKKNVYD